MLKKRLLTVAIVLLFITIICGSLFYYVGEGINNWITYDPTKYPFQQVEWWLNSIANPSATPSASDIQLYEWDVTPDKICPGLLQKYMAENENQYRVVVAGIFGDHGTPAGGTGTDEVVIHVIFPDGSIIHMQFYAATLNLCRPLEKID